MSTFNRFRDLLDKAKDDDQARCWFCNKSEDDIRAEYIEHMNQPENADEDIEMDDLIIMSYKMKKPICAGCFFQMKNNKELVDEIFRSLEEEIWGKEDDQ